MNKITSIERRPGKSKTEVHEHRGTLKSIYREEKKEVDIAEGNVNMLKRIEKIESELSRKRMGEFRRENSRYSKLTKRKGKDVALIDHLFYRQYQQQMTINRVDSGRDKTTGSHGKGHRQLKAINYKQPETVGDQRIEGLALVQ